MASWRRVGEALEYMPQAEGRDIDVGWDWRLDNQVTERRVRVEVAAGSLTATDLPDVARLAISTQGASAVDAVFAAQLADKPNLCCSSAISASQAPHTPGRAPV
jgi:hypothetical protein